MAGRVLTVEDIGKPVHRLENFEYPPEWNYHPDDEFRYWNNLWNNNHKCVPVCSGLYTMVPDTYLVGIIYDLAWSPQPWAYRVLGNRQGKVFCEITKVAR